MGTGVHHHNAVTRLEKELGVREHYKTVVGPAMEKENPIAIGLGRANFPAAEDDAVRRTNDEVFPLAASVEKYLIGVSDLIRTERATKWMKNQRA